MNKYISKLNLKQRVAGSVIILVVIMSLAAPAFSESLSNKEQKLIDSNNRVAEIDKQAYALQLARNEERDKQQCLIKDIAKMKLRDFYNGKTELSKERVQELVDKSNWSCSAEVAVMPEAHAESITLPGNAEKSQISEMPVNLDRLAYAVAMAETQDCATGMGRTKNNCFGIMEWPNGVRTGRTYATKEDSYVDFKRIWSQHYGGFPNYSLAAKWTGNDNPTVWLNNVKHYYNS